MAKKDELGRAGEARAADYLEERGFRILARNWRGVRGEVDIIADDGEDIVIVEVKARSDVRFGHPLEAIDARKRARLWKLGRQWQEENAEPRRLRGMRLDAIALTGRDPQTAHLEYLRDLR